MNVPRQLVLIDGALEMANKEEVPVREYLRCWQRENGIEDGTEVCVITRAALLHLVAMEYLNTCA